MAPPDPIHLRHVAARAFFRQLRRRLRWIFRQPSTWVQRWKQRTELAGLDDRTLRDMGVNRYDIAREVAKPFWRD
ncbi:MAG: DUF1127 domain-containing protein [Magnetospirillum sp.]|nr:DUF1127 domain-containing protein [Magnetospirillum sp.]